MTQDDITTELVTLRDYWRYAISRFNAADLSYGHGTTTAGDDAAFLLLDTLDLPIDTLDPFLDARLLPAERQLLAARIEARVTTRKPSAYLTGRSYIQGVRFFVDERVIVPRSHIGEILFSEYLGGHGSSFLPDPMLVESAVDICTGSGCLAVLAAKFFPQASVDAVDLSADALEVARLNLAEHDVEDQVTLLQGDLFAPLAGRTYDLIITNPPYVDHAALAGYPPEFRAEPEMAHDGGEDGLDLVRKILAEAADHLNPGGGMICEIGSGREILEEEFPHLDFVWLETEQSQDAVFWISAEALGVS
ncbi:MULTISPECIES: 50S ribosomal protein L3 N(5)-glutamine methyltransferase [unclassified Shinella]|uniref:50S ribosomal protein L3 N(5)-glutamine methyltransferase n=1 Tax=unclassified Shinella TaxID=2643062 RepID=UPI00225C5224|nr:MULTISPECIES: 50S ribosomal protein L3 N(5)-glutamine methyltransferase [unclassified Shinella]MCO5138249.1 50S ribosomal protein L3 N(5)-glutamine methyltransferase [Shinella sp.]CAI0337843.1 50S ribosomal protein L3 glutamine methyltransferase [Rhizobiaceae bacterium]CAK7256316.1 Ribosomal protein uL3 glutamine methyltransferase [Shinella sp. WSC3-e]